MTYYDFDKVVNRQGTNSLKYDFAAERGYPADVLPLWVADMMQSVMAFSATAKSRTDTFGPFPHGFKSILDGRQNPNGL